LKNAALHRMSAVDPSALPVTGKENRGFGM
jgi:hypothetical protein